QLSVPHLGAPHDTTHTTAHFTRATDPCAVGQMARFRLASAGLHAPDGAHHRGRHLHFHTLLRCASCPLSVSLLCVACRVVCPALIRAVDRADGWDRTSQLSALAMLC